MSKKKKFLTKIGSLRANYDTFSNDSSMLFYTKYNLIIYFPFINKKKLFSYF